MEDFVGHEGPSEMDSRRGGALGPGENVGPVSWRAWVMLWDILACMRYVDCKPHRKVLERRRLKMHDEEFWALPEVAKWVQTREVWRISSYKVAQTPRTDTGRVLSSECAVNGEVSQTRIRLHYTLITTKMTAGHWQVPGGGRESKSSNHLTLLFFFEILFK